MRTASITLPGTTRKWRLFSIWSEIFVITAGLLVAGGVAHAIDPVQGCQVAKIKAAGKRANCLALEQAKAQQGKPFDLAKCEANFDEALAKADATAATKGAACRYIDNGDGTISDLNTLLQWEKKHNSGGLHDKDSNYSGWANAMSEFISAVNGFSSDGLTQPTALAGHTDWRLPAITELQTLIDPNAGYCGGGSFGQLCVDPIFNNGVDSFTENGYWSSTTIVDAPWAVYAVSFLYGVTQPLDKGQVLFVRAVRGGR